MHIAMQRIAVGIFFFRLPDRVPRPDVGPAGVERHHHRFRPAGALADALHYRVVDGIGRAGFERRFVDTVEAAVAPALAESLLASGQDVAAEAADGIDPDRGAH